MRRVGWIALLLAAISMPSASAAAATLEPIGKFKQPIFVTSDPANPNRIFVVEREGRVVVVDGSGQSVFADLEGLVACCEGERGLLSIALAPDFASSGRFYADYAGRPSAGGEQGDIHVDAFRHSEGTLVRERIITIGHSEYSNHNGGQLQFGPDGYLYISVGDGGGAGDALESGQNLSTLLGKILRIDPRPGELPTYRIPPGNPLAGGPDPEIWSYGLRNPWRFSFDRVTGDLVIADVGQEEREEVDFAPSPSPGVVSGAGTNFGWNCREGLIAYSAPSTACAEAGPFTEPVFDYPHADPENGSAHGCAITGGYVVRDPSLGNLYGRYIYSDFCVGEIRSLSLPATVGAPASGDRSEGLIVTEPTSFGEDSCGRLYIASKQGTVYRLVGASPATCPATSSAPAVRRHHRHLRLRLRARRHGASPRLRVVLTVRATPCSGQQGRRVHLRRGGKPFGAKHLNRRCMARFHVLISRPATFRALLRAGNGAPPIRSRRLAVKLAG